MGIVDLRQSDRRPIDETERPARGLLHQRRSLEHFDLIRVEPSPDLAAHVENYWLILWDLIGKPAYEQQNLSHPSQHLVLDPQGRTGIFGVATGVFTYRLQGAGRVLGTKFRPGAFRGFLGGPVSTLTDTSVPIESVFGQSGKELDAEFLALDDPADMIEPVEDLLRHRIAPLDAGAIRVRELVELIDQDRELFAVAHVASAAGMTVRSLQRLFETYIGAPPKWVIDRYRMIEAVDALSRGDLVSLTELAHRLNYFDQAHFGNAFQRLTGRSPSRYLQP